MKIRPYTLAREPVELGYSNLLKFLFQRASLCGVVVQANCASSESAKSFLASVRPYLVDERVQASWPGTELRGGTTALVQYYAVEWSVLEAMYTAADRLYEWLSPTLPEDPAFYRSDGTVLMGTVSHERDAFLNLTHAEVSELMESAPQLSLVPSQTL